MKMPSLSDFRMTDTNQRCNNYHSEGRRSWRCQIKAAHLGQHVSISGHRHWTDAEGEYR